ncbi:MAG: ROK family transcriptional regulator [Pyrinomonadaceae bacterium]|nr:ROK family transcriptional regulator [Pyrinomonadaceae bacterium]
MNYQTKVKSNTSKVLPELPSPAKTGRKFLRLVRAAQPISRIEIARRMGVNRSTVTDLFKPLVAAGVVHESHVRMNSTRALGRPPMGLTFNSENEFFVGISVGVRRSQVGLTTLDGKTLAEDDFPTPPNSRDALELMRSTIEKLSAKISNRSLKVIGVSVPGVTDAERRKLLYAPHLDWHNVDIAEALRFKSGGKGNKFVPVIVENDAAAAAIYETSLRLKKTTAGSLSDFILVRSGTGIGVGLVLDGEVYRGAGKIEGIAGEFGHMTIVAGGKPCVCGNRGCWERYAAASAASGLYLGDKMQSNGVKLRYVDVVERAESGEIRAIKTIEKIGTYLGIGIANVITGLGVPTVILSGRIVYGWKFLRQPLHDAIGQSMAGKMNGWSVEPGEPTGAGLGGAFEVAVEDFLANGFNHII